MPGTCPPGRDPQDVQEADGRLRGRVKRGLEGKGPTPKAKDRPNHKVYKQNAKADKAAAARPRRRTTGSEAEWIAGRNPVVEALRAGVPVTPSTSPRAPSATGGCARRSGSPASGHRSARDHQERASTG